MDHRHFRSLIIFIYSFKSVNELLPEMFIGCCSATHKKHEKLINIRVLDFRINLLAKEHVILTLMNE